MTSLRSLRWSCLLLILFSTCFHGRLAAQNGPEGLYKIESVKGDGTRVWQLTGNLDGIDVSDFGSIKLKDQMSGPGEVILKEDGTVEATWKNRVTLTYDYQPDYYSFPWANGTSSPDGAEPWTNQWYYHYISTPSGDEFIRPVNELTVEFDTEATGTWSGGVTMTLDCTSECTVTVKYKPENSMDLQTENFTVTLNNVAVTTTATGAPDSLTFKIDMLKTFIQALADQHLTGDRYLAVEDSLRNGTDRVEPNYPPDEFGFFPGGSGGAFIDKLVKEWTYKETEFTSSPTDGELEAKYEQFYLLNVPAPYGFYVQGDWGTVEGLQEVEFRYGGETFRTSVEPGFAEVTYFDYQDAAPLIEADILSDGDVALTLTKDLIKVPVSPWAGPAGSFSSTPGVMYQRTPLDWPVSMNATRALSTASILTGLWGINGSASSTFEVSAHSEGIPQVGNLTANIMFKVAKKEFSLSLTGQHETTLNDTGLTAAGDFSTSPLTAKWRQEASLLSLVPGVGPAIAALGPLGTRISAGAGASVEASLSGSLSGTYMASPGDSNPQFTGGNLTVNASLTAQANPVPNFARGVVNLDISGGGGAIMVITLAPNPSVASLTGYLNFMLSVKFFGLEEDVDKEWVFGDPPPAFSPPGGGKGFSLSPGGPTPGASSFGGGGIPEVGIELPAQAEAAITHGPFSETDVIIYSELHPTLPAPASRIVARYRADFFSEDWSTQPTAGDDGRANFAPVFMQPDFTPSIGDIENYFRGVAVWVQATGAAPANTSELPAFMNTTELRFQYYRTGSFAPGFNPTERSLTSNALADFGPSLVRCAANTQVRLFWVRGDGMDLTGSTTPLQILTRDWTTYDPTAPANDPSTAWTPEVIAASGLVHIVDWRAAAWDGQNAAVTLVADTDGDLATLDDTELWLARQTAGIWAAPVRLTTNGVPDEAPVLHYKSAASLAIGWRQGTNVVGSFDLDAAPTPIVWFNAASEVAEEWNNARLLHRASEDSLVVIWPRGVGLAYSEQAYGPPAAGSAWPKLRHITFDGGVVSAFEASLETPSNDPDQVECRVTVIQENSTPASINDVPMPMPATIHRATLTFGPASRSTTVVQATASNPNPQPGDDLRLAVRVESPSSAITYSWSKDGESLPHFTGAELVLVNLGTDDEGRYTVTIHDGTSTVQQHFTVSLPTTFATWIAGHVPGGGPNLDPEDDWDSDGCPNVLEYLFDTDPTDPADCTIGELTPSGLTLAANMIFHLNRSATDVAYVIEVSENLSDWHDVTSLFVKHELQDGMDLMHLLAPLGEDSINYEAVAAFPFPVTDRSFYRIRIVSGP